MSTNWRGKRCVVTGGAGFIGSNLCERLVHEGARVTVIDNLERGRIEYLSAVRTSIDLVKADLRTPGAWSSVFRGADTVFHLAARVGGIGVYLREPGTILHGNLLIDQQVFGAALSANVPRLFYASSAHVYPGHRQQQPDAPPLQESDAYPAAPALSYGWGKLTAEQTLRALAEQTGKLRISLARIMGAYGPHQDIGLETGSVIPVFCHRAIRWPALSPFVVRSSGRETRSYIYIEDVVEAILRSTLLLERQAVAGPFNLAAEGRNTIQEIAEIIVRISGKPIEIQHEDTGPTAIWGQAADTALATRLLDGWKPAVSLEEGLARVYRHVAQRVSQGVK